MLQHPILAEDKKDFGVLQMSSVPFIKNATSIFQNTERRAHDGPDTEGLSHKKQGLHNVGWKTLPKHDKMNSEKGNSLKNLGQLDKL